MKIAKQYLTLAFVLFLYICATAMLVQQFYVYRKAYVMLSLLISHPTIEKVIVPMEEDGET